MRVRGDEMWHGVLIEARSARAILAHGLERGIGGFPRHCQPWMDAIWRFPTQATALRPRVVIRDRRRPASALVEPCFRPLEVRVVHLSFIPLRRAWPAAPAA